MTKTFTQLRAASETPHRMRRGYNGSDPIMYCRGCRGEGATLTTHCAERMLTDAEEEAIAAGCLDFVRGEWVKTGAAQ